MQMITKITTPNNSSSSSSSPSCSSWLSSSSYLSMLSLLLLLASMPSITHQKVIHKKVTMAQLYTNKPIFLARFDFGTDENNITIKYKKIQVDNTYLSNIKIGLLMDQNYNDYVQSQQNCLQKQQYYSQQSKIRFFDSLHGTQILRINQNIRQHLWFIYIYTCQQGKLDGLSQQQSGLQLEIVMINGGSHLGEDQKLLWLYIALAGGWLAVLLRYLLIPMIRELTKIHTQPKLMVLFANYLVLGLSFFYKLISLAIMVSVGTQIAVFDILHSVLKNSCQGAVITILVSIAWGWTILHLNFKLKYKLIAIFIILTNVICSSLWHYSQQLQDSYHQYEDPAGILVFILRIGIGVSFVIGCRVISTQLVSKRKIWVMTFMKFGAAYLFAWPSAVVICEILLPKYLHNQVITITEQSIHLVANAYICWLFAYPQSSYHKVNSASKNKNDLPGFQAR